MTSRVLAEHYDAVTVVGALGEGQVPISVLPELLRVTKPGKGGGEEGRFPSLQDPRGDGTGHRAPVDAPMNGDLALSPLPGTGDGTGGPDPAHCQVWPTRRGRRWQ